MSSEQQQVGFNCGLTMIVRLSVAEWNRLTDKPGECPIVHSMGICVEQCTSDADCHAFFKCCFNGCGHTCQPPTSIFAYLLTVKKPTLYNIA